MSKVLGIIPARLNSTRLPRKMLVDLLGKPLIVWTWMQAKKAGSLDEVVVATDSEEIAEVIETVGGSVVMTDSKPQTGSDRVAQAAANFSDFKPDIVLNIQGDEPMMPPEAIDRVAQLLIENPDTVMSTVARPFPKDLDPNEPGQVKVVLDRDGYALYFSRHPIPYPRSEYQDYLNHMGIYGYRYDFLQTYVTLEQTPLEQAELLEQLRALENGYRIIVGVGEYNRMEVNEPHELEAARALMEKMFNTKYIP